MEIKNLLRLSQSKICANIIFVKIKITLFEANTSDFTAFTLRIKAIEVLKRDIDIYKEYIDDTNHEAYFQRMSS